MTVENQTFGVSNNSNFLDRRDPDANGSSLGLALHFV